MLFVREYESLLKIVRVRSAAAGVDAQRRQAHGPRTRGGLSEHLCDPLVPRCRRVPAKRLPIVRGRYALPAANRLPAAAGARHTFIDGPIHGG